MTTNYSLGPQEPNLMGAEYHQKWGDKCYKLNLFDQQTCPKNCRKVCVYTKFEEIGQKLRPLQRR